MAELETKNVLSNWFYKPSNLVEGLIFKNGEGNSQISPSDIKAINSVIQIAHNYRVLEKSKTIWNFGLEYYECDLKEFADKISATNRFNIKRDLPNLMSIFVSIEDSNGFNVFQIINDFSFSKNKIYFRLNEPVEMMIQNDYAIIDRDEDGSLKFVYDKNNGKPITRFVRINKNYYDMIDKTVSSNSMRLYEYILLNRTTIKDSKKEYRISKDRILNMLGCTSYTKNSVFLNRIWIPFIEMCEKCGLKVFYDCDLEEPYNKIKNLKIRVFCSDTSIKNYLYKQPEVKGKPSNFYFDDLPNDINNIFRLTKEDYEYKIKHKLTNSVYTELNNIVVNEEIIVDIEESPKPYDDYPIMPYDFEFEMKKQNDIELLYDYLKAMNKYTVGYLDGLVYSTWDYEEYTTKFKNMNLGYVGRDTYSTGVFLTDSDRMEISRYIYNDDEELF